MDQDNEVKNNGNRQNHYDKKRRYHGHDNRNFKNHDASRQNHDGDRSANQSPNQNGGRNRFDGQNKRNDFRGQRPQFPKHRKSAEEETATDIAADTERIEKEIRLEIKEIESMQLEI